MHNHYLNMADGEPAQQTLGGGISIAAGTAGQVALTGNMVISNSAAVEATDIGLGGGVAIASGQVLLENGRLISNTATSGGGLYIGGGLAACCSFGGQDNLFQANGAVQGGGRYLDGQAATLRGGLFISNTATAGGGGLLISAGGMFSLTNSAVIANLAGGDGGAILNSGTISLSNATVSGNRASGMGGGIAIFNLANLTNATISANDSDNGAGVFNNNTVNALNSLLAANSGANCLGVLSSQGYNLEDGGTCALGQPTDMSNTSAQINSLEDNGGASPTHSLAQDSPAIDAGDNTACAARDQRGVPRPLDGDGDGIPVCDIGAFEYQIPSTVLITSDEPDPSKPGEAFTVVFSVTAGVGVPSGVVTVTVANEPDTCSSTLSGENGSCQLSLSAPGTYTLRAAFTSQAGNYLPSQTSAEHTVAEIPLYLPVILQSSP